MTRFFLFRLSVLLVLGSTLLSSCEAISVSPRGAKKDCKSKTAGDSTSTSGTT